MGWASGLTRWTLIVVAMLALYVGFPVLLIAANAAIDSGRAGWPGGWQGWIDSAAEGSRRYVLWGATVAVVFATPAVVVAVGVRSVSSRPDSRMLLAWSAALAGAFVGWLQLVRALTSQAEPDWFVSAALGGSVALIAVAFLADQPAR